MTQDERLDYLLRYLLTERKEYADIQLPDGMAEKRHLLRSLMNVRPPVPASAEFLAVQDAYLQARLAERGVTRLQDMRSAQPGLISGRATSRRWLWMPSLMRQTVKCWGVSCLVTAASTMPSTPMQGCNSVWNAPMSCPRRKKKNPPAAQKSQKPITCPAIMCCTRLARSSMASSPKQTGNCWQAATVPVWNLRRNMPAQRGLLLHFHRRISFPERTRRADRHPDGHGLAKAKRKSDGGDFQCF